MGKYIEMIGKQYGRYTVIGKEKRDGSIFWKCRCSCGNIRYVNGGDLRQGKTKSCGCYRNDWAKTASRKHGLSHTRVYYIWQDMRRRCNDSKEKEYQNYGGRGISVCDDWNKSFEVFYKWAVENGYTDELTIDRIDVNGNYEPSNCRFVTFKEQMNNRTDNHYLTFNSETHTISEWSEITGIQYATLKDRVNKLHWTTDDALTKPVRKITKKF